MQQLTGIQNEKLNSICFNLLRNVGNETYEQMLFRFVEELKQGFEIQAVAVYCRQTELDHFKQVFKNDFFNALHHREHANEASKLNEVIWIKHNCEHEGSVVHVGFIPIKQIDFPDLVIGICVFEANLIPIANDISGTKQTLDTFFYMLHQRYWEKKAGFRHEFLFNIISELSILTDKSAILKQIHQALEARYPSYVCQLMLTQDDDMQDTSMFDLIKFGDEPAKQNMTQAYLTGELQQENRQEKNRTYLYVPLVGMQAVYGVIQLIAPTMIHFSDEEKSLLYQFASAAGKALEKVALYRHSRVVANDLRAINELIQDLNSSQDMADVTRTMKRHIVAVCELDEIGFIYLKDAENVYGDVLQGSTDFFRTENGHTFTNRIVNQIRENDESIFSGDFGNEADTLFRSIVAVPMIESGEMYGLVIMLHTENYHFTFETFKLIRSFVQQGTLALTNAQYKNQLKRMAFTDYLTNLYSRNHLDSKIQADMEFGNRGALILFDIDDFKQVNDHYGHYVGDEVIKQVASIIRRNIREYDVAARWGGEELAVYAPDITIGGGVELAVRIRKQVEAQTNPAITLSSGVSMWHRKTDSSVKGLFIRADQALYKAKRFGKNCVIEERMYQ